MKSKGLWIVLAMLCGLGLLAMAGSSVSADLALAQATLGEGSSRLVIFLGMALVVMTGLTLVFAALAGWMGILMLRDRMLKGEKEKHRLAFEARKAAAPKKDMLDQLLETQQKVTMMELINRMNNR